MYLDKIYRTIYIMRQNILDKIYRTTYTGQNAPFDTQYILMFKYTQMKIIYLNIIYPDQIKDRIHLVKIYRAIYTGQNIALSNVLIN